MPNTEIECLYDVIVVGSGYGASIAASRYARAGQTVCVLEKGAEWLPGDFPELPETAPSYFRVTCNGKELSIGTFQEFFNMMKFDLKGASEYCLAMKLFTFEFLEQHCPFNRININAHLPMSWLLHPH